MSRTFSSLMLLVPAAFAQAPPSVTPEWDLAPLITAFSAQAGRVKPILDQLTPQEWVRGGAPQTYNTQYQSAQQEVQYVATSATAFQKNPDKLTLALDAYFRWQALEGRLTTLAEGVRRFQNPAIGDLLVSVVAENAMNRDKLRQYITDLAAQKEQEFAVVDQEAQRCRGSLTRQAPPRPAPAKKAGPSSTAPPTSTAPPASATPPAAGSHSTAAPKPEVKQ